MVIISKSKLISFYELEPKAKEPLLAWHQIVKNADWSNFADVKKSFNSVDSIGNNRFVFNIGGNKFRLVALIFFDIRTIYIRFMGTHGDYDKISTIKKI